MCVIFFGGGEGMFFVNREFMHVYFNYIFFQTDLYARLF